MPTHPPAQHHRRSVEPQRRLAGHGRPHAAVELPVRRGRLLARRPAPAPPQGDLPPAPADCSSRASALDASLADAVALAMKEWALEKGATHYTHVFQPLTGLTAEKHDSFFDPTGDGVRARRVLGQGADPGRAGRLVVPHRRRAGDLRGARLHGLGPDQPGVHPREPERRAALHPDRVRVVDRRGARRARSRCCARWTRCRAPRSARCGCSATRTPRACSPRSARSRSTS